VPTRNVAAPVLGKTNGVGKGPPGRSDRKLQKGVPVGVKVGKPTGGENKCTTMKPSKRCCPIPQKAAHPNGQEYKHKNKGNSVGKNWARQGGKKEEFKAKTSPRGSEKRGVMPHTPTRKKTLSQNKEAKPSGKKRKQKPHITDQQKGGRKKGVMDRKKSAPT